MAFREWAVLSESLDFKIKIYKTIFILLNTNYQILLNISHTVLQNCILAHLLKFRTWKIESTT